jgi:hypothetical protein
MVEAREFPTYSYMVLPTSKYGVWVWPLPTLDVIVPIVLPDSFCA